MTACGFVFCRGKYRLVHGGRVLKDSDDVPSGCLPESPLQLSLTVRGGGCGASKPAPASTGERKWTCCGEMDRNAGSRR